MTLYAIARDREVVAFRRHLVGNRQFRAVGTAYEADLDLYISGVSIFGERGEGFTSGENFGEKFGIQY